MAHLFPHPDEALLAFVMGAIAAVAVVAAHREWEARRRPPPS